jgi:hypothetical protein
MMQAITTTGLDTRSQSFGFALSIRKAAVPPVGIVEDCSQGTIRNLVCEAMMMGSEGASHGDREGLA